MEKIARKIHFFQLKMSKIEGSSMKEISDIPKTVNAVSEFIKKLPFSLVPDSPTRYYKTYDDNCIYMEVDSITPNHIQGRMILTRKNSLPQLENLGQLSDLNIPKTSGLAEITHFVCFLESNVVGVEYNFFGPRASRIGFYMYEKAPQLVNSVDLEPILTYDTVEKLDDLHEIKYFQLVASRGAESKLAELSTSLKASFKAVGDTIPESQLITISFQKGRKKKSEFLSLPFSKKKAKEFLSVEENRESIKSLKIDDNSLDKAIDLLEDKLIFSKKVEALNNNSRTIVSSSMYKGIVEAYNDNKKKLTLKGRE